MSQEIRPKMSLIVPGEYCNECPNFKPIVDTEDIYGDGRIVGTYRTIRCENEVLCTRIFHYLRKHSE